MQLRFLMPIAATAAVVAACSGGGGMTPNPAGPPVNTTTQSTQTLSATPESAADSVSVLKQLINRRTIGSTIDPVTQQGNPYGLDVAKVTSGKIDAGDLVVCNFNNAQGVEGQGTSIVALHPVIGSTPRHIVDDAHITGCDALATAPSGPIWVAPFSKNLNPIFSASGALINTLGGGPWHNPFGEAFAPPVNAGSVPAFYVSNAGDGSLVRVYVFPGPTFKFATIATGFPINGGAPGSILGPSGLNYQRAGDRLYIVDGQNNALYAIDNVSRVEAGGIVVHGLTFTGKFAGSAHALFHGAPLNGPISSAILPGGHVVLGNTLDPAGKNLMVEFNSLGQELFVKNVDNGAAGAIFGMVATGTSTATTKLYFNDDNDNTVKVLFP